ncbi:MAG: GDSL-type esterase/lipase family protein [Tepidisphaeraceae bacterium]
MTQPSKVETLERRTLASVTPLAMPTFSVDEGKLTIIGTAEADRVTVRSTDTGTVVRLTDDGSIRKRFATGALTAITFNGGTGSDSVNLDAAAHRITRTVRVERRNVLMSDGEVTHTFSTVADAGIDDISATNWMKRFKNQKAELVGENPKTVLIGDSITENMLTTGQTQWETLQSKYDAANLGFAGDTTSTLLYRLKHGLLNNIWPKVIFLSIGTNNVALTDSVASTVRGIRQVLRTIHAMRPKAEVVLSSILPRNVDRDQNVVGAVNAHLDELTAAYDAVFADARNVFTPANTTTADFDAASVHLSSSGYARWTPVIDQALSAAARRAA